MKKAGPSRGGPGPALREGRRPRGGTDPEPEAPRGRQPTAGRTLTLAEGDLRVDESGSPLARSARIPGRAPPARGARWPRGAPRAPAPGGNRRSATSSRVVRNGESRPPGGASRPKKTGAGRGLENRSASVVSAPSDEPPGTRYERTSKSVESFQSPHDCRAPQGDARGRRLPKRGAPERSGGERGWGPGSRGLSLFHSSFPCFELPVSKATKSIIPICR